MTSVEEHYARLAAERRALYHWFEVSGTTIADLIEKIERFQPLDSDNPINGMGLGPELRELVTEEQVPNGWARLQVLRGIQTLVCTRPWRRSYDEPPKRKRSTKRSNDKRRLEL